MLLFWNAHLLILGFWSNEMQNIFQIEWELDFETSCKFYRVVKRNCQVKKIVNLGRPNDFMTQKSSLIFVKTIFGWDQVKDLLPSLKVASIEAKIQLSKNL